LQPAKVTELSVIAFKERLKKELSAFDQAFREGTARGDSPARAFRAAAERELGGLCDPDAITNVVLGIAADFRRDHGADIARDPNALPRLATAYLDALDQLRVAREHELNIPFLTTTETGPLHFRQRVTIDRLTELAGRAPEPVRAGA